ncbi:MAG: DUF393 domain-containing protein [Bacteroidetes bacterium]|nr:DUF393 domain-containing protein [Bacteroidota bacterium]
MEKIILFDGVCNLCNASVQFILKRDKHRVFKFASLQSEFAEKLLIKLGYPDRPDTIVLIDGDKIFVRSDATLTIARHLSGLWPACYILKVIPRFLRDFVYRIVAKNRYRWFGKSDHCLMPSSAFLDRFILQ